MKKLILTFVALFFAACIFAQNVKPYVLDLNSLPSSNEQKTISFNKATKTFTVNGDAEEWKGLGIWPYGGFDISAYNIVRIKYKVPGDYGFHFGLEYEDDEISWADKTFYCPPYLTEMVIPLKSGQKKINGIHFAASWHIDSMKFTVESVTFEKVANPVKTDIHASNEAPVVDTAKNGTFNDKLTAWDFVQALGPGYQYLSFCFSELSLDFGMDIYHPWGDPKATKEFIDFVKAKGFTTLRLPFNPGNHFVDDKHTIDPRFIKELKQVADWAIEEGMNVILCGFFWPRQLEEAYNSDRVRYEGIVVNEKYQKQGEEFLRDVWKQIATAFNNSYDQRLIFETLNECGDDLHPEHNHKPQEDCPVCKKDFEIINRYNQFTLDTIRATGGNNAKRFVMVEAYGGAVETLCSKSFKLPKDKAKNKLIPTFHSYLMGAVEEDMKMFYSSGVKKAVSKTFELLDKSYFSKHIPVCISEMGTFRATPVLEKINFVNDFMAEANKKGRSCATVHHFDPGAGQKLMGFRYYNRKTMEWEQSEYLDTYIYAAQGKKFPLSEDFIKKNEVKVQSIVGKNLLKASVQIKDFDNSASINPDILIHSVPAKYKFEINVEKLAADSILQLGFADWEEKWRDLVKEKNVTVKGGSIKDGWCIAVKDDLVTVTVDENLAAELEGAKGIFINGQNVIIKSVKVVE